MRKKILIITDNVRDQVNGVVTTFKNLEIQANRDGYDIVYIDPGQFHHCNAPGYPEVKLSWPWRIGSKIKEMDPDHIHIATEGPIGFAARIWLDSCHWRYNTSYHTKFPEFLKNIYGIPQPLTYAYLRWFHKHSGRVLTTTMTMVQELKDHGFAGDIVSWSRGVDRDIFWPDSTYRKKEKPVLLCVSRISKEKGLDDFCSLDYDARKIVVGHGPYLNELKTRYPDVEFVGVKHGKELADYYRQADVFVFPSKTDTFGIVIIEALACGTPVAAYPVPGPIDILESETTGEMDNDLRSAIDRALSIDRSSVYTNSLKWSWESCWKIFKDNLVEIIR